MPKELLKNIKAVITITSPQPTFESELTLLKITDNSTPTNLITQAGYDEVNTFITKQGDNLTHTLGQRYAGVWHPNHAISSDAAELQISLMTVTIDGHLLKGRAASIEELAAYEIKNIEALKDIYLIALKEEICDGSNVYVALRCACGSGRGLYLGRRAGFWGSRSRFLVIFEVLDSSVPQTSV